MVAGDGDVKSAVGTLNKMNPCLEALTVNVVVCTD